MTDLRICIMQCTCSSGHWLRRTGNELDPSFFLLFSDTDGCVTPVSVVLSALLLGAAPALTLRCGQG